MNSKENDSPRSPIPANIRRRVLVEAGHRCAIPTCRSIVVDVHHIVPWAQCHEHRYENLIALCPNCHRMAHDGTIDQKALRIYKANLRYTHDKFSQFEVDMLFECYKAFQKNTSSVPFVMYLIIMVKRLIDAGYITVSRANIAMKIGGLDNSPIYLTITRSGIDYIESLGLEWATNPIED